MGKSLKEGSRGNPDKLSLKELVAFGIGPTGKSLTSSLVYGSFLSLYFMSTLGISPAFLAVMFFCARIWDGVNDLMMGAIIDHTHSRFGKFRPWIFWGALSNALIAVLLYWNPGFTGVGLYIYVTVLYLLCDATFTMIDVGYWAMIPALTLDPKERDKVSIIPRVTGVVGSLIGMFTMNIVKAMGGTGVNAGYLRFSIVSAGFYILTSTVCAVGVRECVVTTEPVGQKFSFIKAARVLFRNDQALVVVGIMILFNVCFNLMNGVMLYYFKFVLLAEDSYGYFSVITGVASGVGLLGFPLLSKKVGRDKLYRFVYILPVFGFIAMGLLNYLAPENLVLFCVAAFVTSISYGSLGIMQNVMLADAVDYGEWRFGERNEGIIFSMLTFLSKISNGIKDLIIFAGFALVGFNADDSVAASDSAVTAIKLILYVLPPFFMVGAYILHRTKFKLKPELTSKISAELIEKHSLNKTEGEI